MEENIIKSWRLVNTAKNRKEILKRITIKVDKKKQIKNFSEQIVKFGT